MATDVKCPECGSDYNLRQISAYTYKCMECGEYFDAEDIETFERIPQKRPRYEDDE